MSQTTSQMHHLQQQQQQQQQQQGTFAQHVAAQTNGGQRDGVQWGGPFPSLHLWPIQETFTMKMIHLPEGQRIKIGRQTNNKTVPGERNAYFDSKVLSRTHAEIWEQNDKIYIKDLKSSNGTFVNNERLSPEGLESEPYELKTEDIVEFGIDIVSEDNRTIVHHKVAAKVYCVFGEEDAALSSREVVHYHDGRNIRRPAAPSQGAGSQAGALPSAVMSSGGKASGLSFDHVLNKLQLELQKSKEAGAELQNLSAAMNDIQDTLGGGLPPAQNGSAAQFIPHQYRSMSAEAQAALTGPHGQQAAAFISLQNQLGETQTSLSSQLDKIHLLETRLTDHESLRDELSTLREQMENGRREVEGFLSSLRDRQSRDDDDDVDDDAKSVVTLMDNEDAEERVRQIRQAENGEGPTHNGHASAPDPSADSDARLQSMSAELAEAVQTSKTLQMQQLELLSTVRQLTQRIGVIEDGIAGKIAEEINKAEKRWDAWRAECESGWKRERESWEAERERLRGVVREWEEASRRGHEEVEERELNERLSENEYEDDDDDAEGEPDEAELLVMGPGWKEDTVSAKSTAGPGPSRRMRRRRPSHRTTLAVRALKSIADETGSSTPKADAATLDDTPNQVVDARLRNRNLRAGGHRGGSNRLASARNGSSGTLRNEKDSSESGRDSGDTLKELGVESRKSKRRVQHQSPLQQPIPIFTVIMVAVVAGALYYRHKD